LHRFESARVCIVLKGRGFLAAPQVLQNEGRL